MPGFHGERRRLVPWRTEEGTGRAPRTARIQLVVLTVFAIAVAAVVMDVLAQHELHAVAHGGSVGTSATIVTVAILAIAVCFAAFMTLAMNHVIFRRMRELDSAIRRRQAGDPSARLRWRGDDELSRIGRNFDAMVDAIDEAQRSRSSLQDRLADFERLEAIGQLAGGIAHDFNNLLAVMINSAHFALRELESNPAGARRDLEEIRRAAERAATLTRQLLIFSRRERIAPQVLPFNMLIRGMEELLRRALGEHVDLELALDPELPPVRADPGRMEQVLLNLAVNARDAMPEGGVLWIETMKTEGSATIAISDTGVGMSADVRKRAFEPFYTTKAKGTGTGLGLATVYGVVVQAGGTVEIESEERGGTTVRIQLPAANEPVEDVVEVPEIPGPPSVAGMTVLVVEDEDAVARAAERILSEAGCEVLATRDSREARRVFDENSDQVDLVLADVVMPKASGPELARALRAAKPDLPVLYMSGYPDELLNAEDGDPESTVLRKPFTPETLLGAVAGAMRERSAG